MDIDKPQGSPASAQVRVTARPIQPADLAFVRGQYRLRPAFPQTPGLEGAGVVVQAGAFGNIKEAIASHFGPLALGRTLPQSHCHASL
jgi:NADPH:quinone reductase-like Zn-dependent oxidoreductase